MGRESGGAGAGGADDESEAARLAAELLALGTAADAQLTACVAAAARAADELADEAERGAGASGRGGPGERGGARA